MLPPNIPHNEAILIPNHYKVRATASTEYRSDEHRNSASMPEAKASDTVTEYTPPFPIHLYPSNKKDFRQDSLIKKPPLPLDKYELKPTVRQRIDPDRESQIAWSDEESVHTDWSESNVWSDEDDFAFDRGEPFVT